MRIRAKELNKARKRKADNYKQRMKEEAQASPKKR